MELNNQEFLFRNNQTLSLASNEELFNISSHYYSQNEFQKAYEILHYIELKNVIIPNLHYNLAMCAYKLENISLALTHLKLELKYFNNIKAFSLYEKLSLNSSPPYLTITISLLFLVIYFLFFNNYSSLDLFYYSLHHDTLKISGIITSFFFHSSYLHLFSNILIFLLLGSFLEKFLSKLQYLTIFFGAGLLGNMLQVLLISEFNAVVGMSGSIFGFLAIILLKSPLLSIPIPIFKLKIPILFITIGLYIFTLISMQQSIQTVAHYSHLFGFLVGLGVGVLVNSNLRSRFYALLIATFGTLLLTGLFIQVDTIFTYFIVDIIIGVSCIVYSYSYLKMREEIMEEL
ncbi:MAG: rhomboid family intramembrane serine protease [Nanoarchaeota archaeon]|nr:rhomboid family intramembrane serine protease [Nanoarchaeota archaeon]